MRPPRLGMIAGAVALGALNLAGSAATIHVPSEFETIQEAISNAGTLDGDVIVVQAGTYIENINFFGKAITLQSADPSDAQVVASTVIDGGGLDSTVICNSGEGPGTVLNGFTITNGFAKVGGGMFNFLSSPTVIGCDFINNTAEFGGGYSGNVASDPTILNCRFLGNTAVQGGGVYVSSSSAPLLANCSFGGNDASEGGAIIVCGGDPTVVNCTFGDNTALTAGGGIYVCSGGPVLSNCIVWGNTPDQLFEEVPAANVTYSDVQGGFAGTGNIDANPWYLFANGDDLLPGTADDNRGLSVNSPCIDAGNNLAVPLDTVDLDADGDTAEAIPLDLAADPRFIDDPLTTDSGNPDGIHPIVDMGAREFKLLTCPADCADGDGVVGIADFLSLLSEWGNPGYCDLNGGGVDLGDFLQLLNDWGPCP